MPMGMTGGKRYLLGFIRRIFPCIQFIHQQQVHMKGYGQHEKAPVKGPFHAIESISDLLYVFSFRAFRAIFHIKGNLVTFGQRLETFALNGSMVDKYVTAVFFGYEAVSFGLIKPLNSSIWHADLPPCSVLKITELCYRNRQADVLAAAACNKLPKLQLNYCT